MVSKNKKRFKPKRIIGRFLVKHDIEKWIPDGPSDSILFPKVKKLSDSEFERIAFGVLVYPIDCLFYSLINSVLSKRVDFYLESLKSDILKITNCSRSSHKSKQMTSVLQDSFFEVEKNLQTLWLDLPDYLSTALYNKDFFAVLTQLSMGNKEFIPRDIRRNVTYEFYMGIEKVRWLFRIRYQKDFNLHYEKFVNKNVLRNRNISSFIRSGKTKSQDMDLKDFEDTRTRFLRRFRNKTDSKI